MGRQLFEYAFLNLKELLEDEDLKVRVATAWEFKQLTVNDDGCQRMVENSVP